MSRLPHLRSALAIGLALGFALLAQPGGAEPVPASSMVVSLVVQQSCLISASEGVSATAPAVSCLHGEPYLVSQSEAPAMQMASAVQFDSQRSSRAFWTVTF